jgi:hypothetical protein
MFWYKPDQIWHTQVSARHNLSTEGDLLHNGRINVTADVINFMQNNTELWKQWMELISVTIHKNSNNDCSNYHGILLRTTKILFSFLPEIDKKNNYLEALVLTPLNNILNSISLHVSNFMLYSTSSGVHVFSKDLQATSKF